MAIRARGGGGARPGKVRVLVATLLVVALGSVGCSKNSDGAKAPRKTATTVTSRTSTTGSPETTSTVPGVTTAPIDPTAPAPVAYSGRIDGQPTTAQVTFVLTDALERVEVKDLTIECQPLDGQAEPETRTIGLSFPRATIAKGRTVSVSLGSARMKPSLSGSFSADNAFSGALFLSGEDDGFVCGGEFTFTARPG